MKKISYQKCLEIPRAVTLGAARLQPGDVFRHFYFYGGRRIIFTHFFLTLVFFFIMANLAFAETKVFVEEYTYQASEADSKLSSRAIAFEQAKRLLLERLGTYLESETEVKNFQLTKDQIITLTAGIVRAEIMDERWDGKTYYLKAKISADPNGVANSIDNLRQDRQKIKELEETRKKADEALREVERLRKELETAKAEKPNLNQYNEAVNSLSATDWFEKGYALGNSGKWHEAIEANNKAIELNPTFVAAYNNRGNAYASLGNHRQAIKDYDRAIGLDPNYASAYNNRGNAYSALGDNRQAIRDCGKAIELNPKIAQAYYNRGNAYFALGDNRQAIRDFDKAIDLNPNFAWAYYNRGNAYRGIGGSRQAIEDYKSAARLGHRGAQNYLRSKGVSW
jgi:tetratricopeptide (TPR) repeat protein